MSRLDVAELEQRVRRRLAVTQHLDVVGGRDPVSLDAKKGHASTNCSVVASKRSFERRLPGDGGPPIPKAGGVDVRVVQRACDGISLFKTLRRDDRQRLYESMYQLEYEPGERVVRAGEDGRNFYVVVDGYLNVTVEDSGGNDSGGTPVSSTLSTSAASSHDDSKYSKYAQASYQSSTPQYTSHHPSATSTSHKAHVVINTLSPGDTFGEVSLLHSVPRSATVAAAGGRVKLWALDRRTFKTILQKCAFERRELNTALLRRVEILKGLDDYGLGLLSDACGYAFFQKGEMIFKQNEIDETTKFHVIERGAVSVRLSNNGAASGQKQEVNQLGKGSYFGEVSVLFGTAPTASVVASTDVSTLTLDRAAFKRMLGDDVLSAMTEFAAEYAYDEDITADFRKAGDPALKSGAYDVLRQHFASGAARRREDPTGRRARGERAMAGAASRERDETTSFMRWQESVTAGNSSGNFDKENAVESVSDKGSKPRSRSTICERDLTFHKELGVGMSGVVYLAKVKHTNAVCCVKVMRKRKLLRLEQATNITRELALSKAFGDDTNFIMQSLTSFQDKHSLYMVMEFMPGGDLFQMLVHGTGTRGAFTPACARFYGAEVFLALEFLHHRQFVYRDLKPENVLVGADGHCKLADLGFCKKVNRGTRTYTTCGTSDYMAPEVMVSQGYDQSADIWAFGVFVFELLSGYAPFKAASDSTRHARILQADLKFKPDFPLNGKDLVSKLCVVDISLRLGCTNRGLDDIKDHQFWETDWDVVASRGAKPPAMPEMKDPARLAKLPALRGVCEPTTKTGEELTATENAMFAEY